MANSKSNKGGDLFGDKNKRAQEFRQSVDDTENIAARKQEIQDREKLKKIQGEKIKETFKEIKQYEELVKKGIELTEWEKDLLQKAKERLTYEREQYSEIAKDLQEIQSIEKERFKVFEKSITANQELEEINTSIVNRFGKGSKLAKEIGGILESQTVTLRTNASIIHNMGDEEQRKQAIQLNESYKNTTTSIANAANELEKGNISQEEYNNIIIATNKQWEDVLSTIKATSPQMAELVKNMKLASATTNSFYEGSLKSKDALDSTNNVLDQFASNGIPLFSQLADVIKNKINKNLDGTKLAIRALGAAAGVMIANFAFAKYQVELEAYISKLRNAIDLRKKLAEIDVEFNPELVGARTGIEKQKIDSETVKSGIETQKKIGNVQIDIQNEVAKSRIENVKQIRDLEIEAAYAGQRAAIQFNAEMQSAAASFKASAKTALFGRGLGSVGYGAAQLQMAGISAETIADQMSVVSSTVGKMPMPDMAAAMSVFAKRSGASGENVAELNKMFMLTEGATEKSALNLQQGMEEMANKAGISFKNLMVETAEASKDMLGYQIKSGKVLTRQIAAAQSIGVSFTEVAKAGRNMVLNYKDSIKSEMQLSAMLGKQVDLSEVRSKFMTGDVKGAMEALKAQGLNPEDMDMFQQEALMQATGMDLATLQKISKGEMKEVGPLKEGAAGKENKDFLGRTVQAQAALNAQQASISAQTAIIDAKLSQKILEQQLNDPANAKFKTQMLQQEQKEVEQQAALQKAILDELNKTNGAYQTQLKSIAEAEAMYHKQFQDALMNSKKYLDALAEEKQLNIGQAFIENIIPTLGGVAGGLFGNVIANRLGKKNKVVEVDEVQSTPSTRTMTRQPNVATNRTPSANVSRAAQLRRANPNLSPADALRQARSVPEKGGLGKMFGGLFKSESKGLMGIAGKGLGKGLMKKLPGVGAIIGVSDAIDRFKGGDKLGALLTAASGVASIFPGLGTAAATFIDAGLIAKDMNEANKANQDEQTSVSNIEPNVQQNIETAYPSSPSTNMGKQQPAQQSMQTLYPVLSLIQTQAHERGIITLEKMQKQINNDDNHTLTLYGQLKAHTGIMQKMFTYDDVRGKIIWNEMKKQTKYLETIKDSQYKKEIETLNKKSVDGYNAMIKNLEQLVDLTEANVELMDLLYQKTAGATTSPTIKLDGRILNDTLMARQQSQRTTIKYQ